MSNKTSKVVKYALSFLLAGLLLYFAFRGIDWQQFAKDFKQTRWGYVILFFMASALALVFREERWRALLEPFDPEVRRLKVWDAVNVSNVANVVLPGVGEFLRCGYLRSRNVSYDKVFGTIVCERICDVVSIIVIFAIVLCSKWSTFGAFFSDNIVGAIGEGMDMSLWWIAAPLIVLAVLYFTLVFKLRSRSRFCERNARAISNIVSGFAVIARVRNKLAFTLYTIGIWVMYLLMCYFMFLAVPPLSHLGLMDALIISGVGNIASVIPVPGGIGAYHYLVSLCLESIYGMSWETGILYATLNHELHAILIMIFGLLSYLHLTLHKRK